MQLITLLPRLLWNLFVLVIAILFTIGWWGMLFGMMPILLVVLVLFPLFPSLLLFPLYLLVFCFPLDTDKK